MKNLLVVHSSGRVTRSITRRLASRFVEGWQAQFPEAKIVTRDLTANPPPVVNEAWIVAAFDDQVAEPPPAALVLSNELIAEIKSADFILLGVPIYNFGVPAQMKAYIDQLARNGLTYSFDAKAEIPYRPLLASKPVVVITAAGEGEMFPGGTLAHMNHLEPHLITAFGFMGLTDLRFIRAGYDEYQDDRTKRSLARAEGDVDAMVNTLVARQTTAAC
jgi:FMN-dependent NADH-azoreductase